MKKFTSALIALCALAACSTETKVETASAAPTETAAPATTSSAEPEAADATNGTWAGQLRIDAHAGNATLNYVGAESGDFVPLRFRTDSEPGAKILAACGDEDRCEFDGAIRLLNEPPPDGASAVGEIVRVDRAKKLPNPE